MGQTRNTGNEVPRPLGRTVLGIGGWSGENDEDMRSESEGLIGLCMGFICHCKDVGFSSK